MSHLQDIAPKEPDSVKLAFACNYRSEKNVREHAHACMELIFIREGSCTMHTEQCTLCACAGDLVTMPARQVHDQISDGYIDTVYCGFIAPPEMDFPEPLVIPQPDPVFIEKCMSLLVSVYLGQIQAAADAVDTVASAVLKQLRQQHVFHQEQKQIPPLLRVILRYIDDNLDQPIIIQTLAEHMHMSVSNLQMLFRTCLDSSPLQYLQNQRMQAARSALRTPYLSVKEVATICGYPDVNYFVRTFRKVHGVPPGLWRKQQEVAM